MKYFGIFTPSNTMYSVSSICFSYFSSLFYYLFFSSPSCYSVFSLIFYSSCTSSIKLGCSKICSSNYWLSWIIFLSKSWYLSYLLEYLSKGFFIFESNYSCCLYLKYNSLTKSIFLFFFLMFSYYCKLLLCVSSYYCVSFISFS